MYGLILESLVHRGGGMGPWFSKIDKNPKKYCPGKVRTVRMLENLTTDKRNGGRCPLQNAIIIRLIASIFIRP
jgi:hypothetical protein